MKQVRIIRMALHYFKGIKNKEVEFGPTETIFSGPNGCGKSTIMDAFFWALWGKNAAGQSDQKFLIKTVDETGREIPHMDHEVELTLDVDGEIQAFKRTMTPKYDKEDNLKGNVTSYAWNDVPLKQSEYNAKVAEIISEDVFKLISSPYTFLALPWDKQREMLMKMAGDISDDEVADGREDIRELLERLTGKTLEEYRREIDAKLKRVNEGMKDIPARIDEVRRSLPEAPDLKAIEEQTAQLQEELEAIEKAERDEAAAINAKNAERNRLAEEIGNLKTQAATILQEAESKERTQIHVANATYNEAESMIRSLQSEDYNDLQAVQREQGGIQRRISADQLAVRDLDRKLDAKRQEWTSVSKETFEAEDYLKCPLYGNICHDGEACSKYDQNQGAAFEKWQERQQERLDTINRQGQEMAQQKAEILQDAQKAQQEYEDAAAGYQARKAERDEKIETRRIVMKASPKRPLIATVKGEDIPEWVAINVHIEVLQEQMDGMQFYTAPDSSESEAQKARIREQQYQLKVQASAADAISRGEQRISQLEEENSTLGAQKAQLEYERGLINEFEILKTELVGARVNGLFKIVRWQMFQRQVNGEEVPACICLCGGVRYNDANTADKLNAGIDVASALSTAYGVSAPIFIDNAECCINIFNPRTSQRILLQVAPLPEMHIATK